MEVTPLTHRHWLIFVVIAGISTLLGAFVWHSLTELLFSIPLLFLPSWHLALLGLMVIINAFLVYLLMRLRLLLARYFWLRVWTVGAPLILSSAIHLPFQPALSLGAVWCVAILYAVWGYYRCFSPLLGLETNLHTARFARRHELADLYTQQPPERGLLLGVNHPYRPFRRFVCVLPTRTRRVLGNMMVVAPTQIGKSLLATAQLLSWQHSVLVNDIKGELFEQTAGFRSSLGPVYVIDPQGIGHCYDPLLQRRAEGLSDAVE